MEFVSIAMNRVMDAKVQETLSLMMDVYNVTTQSFTQTLQSKNVSRRMQHVQVIQVNFTNKISFYFKIVSIMNMSHLMRLDF
jgi:hypothetical protein